METRCCLFYKVHVDSRKQVSPQGIFLVLYSLFKYNINSSSIKIGALQSLPILHFLWWGNATGHVVPVAVESFPAADAEVKRLNQCEDI